jgi:alkylation response protein AidB-like acyl-CoA dehydrogenase
VRIPAKDLLGEENRGWYVGTTTLDYERSSIGTSIAQGQMVEDLLAEVALRQAQGERLSDAARAELADRFIESSAARLMSYNVISMQNRGLVPNHEASAVKIYAGELNQRIQGTALKLMGLFGQLTGAGRGTDGEAASNRYAPAKGKYARAYLGSVASTIAGGTSEINRNIIATRGLGLPR